MAESTQITIILDVMLKGKLILHSLNQTNDSELFKVITLKWQTEIIKRGNVT